MSIYGPIGQWFVFRPGWTRLAWSLFFYLSVFIFLQMACIDCIPTCGFTLPYLLLQVRYLKKIKGNKISAEKSERLGWDKNYTLVPYGKKNCHFFKQLSSLSLFPFFVLLNCGKMLLQHSKEYCKWSTKTKFKILNQLYSNFEAIFWSVVALNCVALHCSVSGHSGSSSVQTKPSNLSKTPFKMIQYHYLKYILKPQSTHKQLKYNSHTNC